MVPGGSDHHRSRQAELLDRPDRGDQGWQLSPDAHWRLKGGDGGVDSQRKLYEMARQRSRRVTGRDGARDRRGPSRSGGEGLGVWPGFRVPDLQAAVPWMVPADREEHLLDAASLDASDLRLVRMGITFRHRHGGG